MSHVAIKNTFSGKETVFENYLPPAYIQTGNLVLYNGVDTTLLRWSSCAVITHVDYEREIFKIKLLFPPPEDTAALITAVENFYSFSINQKSGSVRLSMQPVTAKNASDVISFLKERQDRLEKALHDKKQECSNLEATLLALQNGIATLEQ